MRKRKEPTLTEQLTALLTTADQLVGIAKGRVGTVQDKALDEARSALDSAFKVIVAIQQQARSI